MCAKTRLSMPDEPTFQSVAERNLSPADVLARIMAFISQNPKASYHFIIGTDSQVHRGYTKFVTGIIIHRLGQGAWACYKQTAVNRELTSIREKLALETLFSQRVAAFFNADAVGRMEDLLLPYVYQGAMLETYIDIDAGTEPSVNKTSLYVQEMMDKVEAMGMYAPRVKPEAYAASSYANRHTKKPIRLVM